MSKEKAKELRRKYWDLGGICFDEANEMAIIACQRTIKVLKEVQEKENSDLYFYLEEKILEETQTIEELKKL